MQEYLVCLIPKYSAQNITSNLAICFWNIADYFGILVILQAIFNRILIGIRGFSCSVSILDFWFLTIFFRSFSLEVTNYFDHFFSSLTNFSSLKLLGGVTPHHTSPSSDVPVWSFGRIFEYARFVADSSSRPLFRRPLFCRVVMSSVSMCS